jgi:hypothetical protein
MIWNYNGENYASLFMWDMLSLEERKYSMAERDILSPTDKQTKNISLFWKCREQNQARTSHIINNETS